MTLCWNLKWFTIFSMCYWLFAYFHCVVTVPAWPHRDKKTLLSDVEEKPVMEAWHLLDNKEEGGLPPTPHFSSYYKTVAHWVLEVQHALAYQLVSLKNILF